MSATGRLGIGIFGFQQVGRKCTFYSRKTAASETLRVVLKERSEEASIDTALARDRLVEPGLRVVISDLKLAFEDGSHAHSRFVDGVVQANTLNPDYAQATRSSESRLAYAALLIGKETMAFNDRSGLVSDFLEKLLDLHFKIQAHTRGRIRRRRPVPSPKQAPLPR